MLARRVAALVLSGALVALSAPVAAQVAPTAEEVARYAGLFAAAARDDADTIERVVHRGRVEIDARDARQRTPLHVAAFRGAVSAMRALVKAGADPNALEIDRYDIVTIAAVANDLPTLRAALALGCRATNVTSRYDGTALIAAAHLGHAEVVRELVRAKAPLDHVNNLGWTALLESIILGDGGARHTATLAVLVEAGARLDLADRSGITPLAHARGRNYREMAALLQRAGATR